MTAQEAKSLLIECIEEDKASRRNYRYTRKHPLQSKKILRLLK